MTAVMWFRRDLRLEDNIALKHAMEESEELYLMFHVNPDQFLDEGSLNQAAFFKSVEALKKEVREKGAVLHILYGDLKECFEKLKQELPDWSDVYVNRDEKGYGLKRDRVAGKVFKELNINAHAYHDHNIHSAHEIKTHVGTYYKVFTPYFNKWKELRKPDVVEVVFDSSKIAGQPVFEEDLTRFEQLLNGLSPLDTIKAGTQEAHRRLDAFIDLHLNAYKEARDYPMKDGTSHLSRHLRAGEISVRTVLDKVKRAENSAGKETFIQELAWRDFYNMIYATHPDQKEISINPSFRQVEWDNNEQNFERWKEGRTGFPIVDAAMRQLKETGWMHNRLRMITASFLTKDLLIDWRWGEGYFQEMLTDYDPASNIGGWQWAASTGTDGVPYFRVFNPTTQSERFDQGGGFIRKYVPELARIDNKKIHEPAKLKVEEQQKFGVVIGQDYPGPIVSHKTSRQLAIQAFEKSKSAYRQSDDED